MRCRILWVLLLSNSLWACGTGTPGEPGERRESIIVAAAASMQFAIDSLERAFEDSTGIVVEVVISSSGKLTAQIRQGAPYDLFLSADMKYPHALYQDGWSTTPPAVYALGRLVLWSLKKDLTAAEGLEVLLEQNISKIAIANPRNAPYGAQAVRAFKHYGLYEKLAPKLVYGESVAQTNQYILSGACEAGITAKSVMASPRMKNRGYWKEIPSQAYQTIEQGMIITRHGQQQHARSSRRFYDFLFSETAAAILKDYGFAIPPDAGGTDEL